MEVLIDNRQNVIEFGEDLEEFIVSVIKTALEYENCQDNYEISISLVSDEEMKDLNKRFRNIDKTTDVLSFPMDNFIENLDDTLFGELFLGDIVISTGKTKEQALEYGHSFRRELAFLLIHGILHLLGYDHYKKNEEDEMFFKQEQIIKRLTTI